MFPDSMVIFFGLLVIFISIFCAGVAIGLTVVFLQQIYLWLNKRSNDGYQYLNHPKAPYMIKKSDVVWVAFYIASAMLAIAFFIKNPL